MPLAIENLLSHVPVFALVMFRITGLFVLAPMLGSRLVPVQVKAMFALGVALCVYPALGPLTGAGEASQAARAAALGLLDGGGVELLAVPLLIVNELLIGFVIGFGATLPLMGAQMGGRIIDQQIGLGIAEFFNPDLNDTTGVLGEFFFITTLTLFVLVNGHRAMLEAVAGSFDRIPLGGMSVGSDMGGFMLGMATLMLDLALRVSGPLLSLVLLESVAMGFIARTVPQLNILSVGFPLRILIGLGLLVACATTVSEACRDAIETTLSRVTAYLVTAGG